MRTVEDRLADAASTLRREVGASIDVDAALAQVTDPALTPRPSEGPSRRRPNLLLVAAAVLAIAAIVGALLVQDDEEPLVSHGDVPNPTNTTADPAPISGPEVPFELLADISDSPQRRGSIAYSGIPDAHTDQWMAVSDAPVPDVDFDRRIVLSLTLSEWSGCPVALLALDFVDERMAPNLAVGGGEDCGPLVVHRTFVVAIDRADLTPTFTVALPAAPDKSVPEQTLEVDLSTNAASNAPPSPVSDGPVIDGPDLQPPASGREITFEGLGDVRLGQVLDPSEVEPFEGGTSCGYWGPQEPSHDGDEPPGGLVRGADGPSPEVWTIMVRANPRYRTASGVGIGTTLATLERVYGDRLVVDRTGAGPTSGLRGTYQDVAAVRYGDNAITFYLWSDVVSTVKVSPFDFWGDDEGCA